MHFLNNALLHSLSKFFHYEMFIGVVHIYDFRFDRKHKLGENGQFITKRTHADRDSVDDV